MKKFLAALTMTAAVLPATLSPLAAQPLGRSGKSTTVESAAAANGEKTYLKTLDLDCSDGFCSQIFKGKAGRRTTISEIQCVMAADAPIQGGQVFIDNAILELLPVASHATNGNEETAFIKTPTNLVVEGTQKVIIILYTYGTGTFGRCIVKGTSVPS